MSTRADVLREVGRSRQRRRNGRLIFFFILIFFLALGSIIFFNNYFLIMRLEVVGTQAVASEQIIVKASEVLAGRNWLVLPRRSLLFYPEQELVAQIKSSFPRLAQIKIEWANESALRLVVSERRAMFIICGISKNNCFYLDREGILFTRAPTFSADTLLTIEAPASFEPSLDSKFEQIGTLTWIEDFVSELTPVLENSLFRGEQPVKVSLGEEQDLKFYIRDPRRAEKSWLLLVSQRLASPIALKNLIAALTSETFKQELVARRLEIDYIDLRFEHKVFYKFLTSDIMEQ